MDGKKDYNSYNSSSLFLTISLHAMSAILVIQYFWSCAMSSVSWYFIQHLLYVVPPSPSYSGQTTFVFQESFINILISEFSLVSSFFLQPNILYRMSLLVWWLFWKLCLSNPRAVSLWRASSYHTSPGYFLPLHPPDSALNIKLLEPLAQGASRFEKLLPPPPPPPKIHWPPIFCERRKSE